MPDSLASRILITVDTLIVTEKDPTFARKLARPFDKLRSMPSSTSFLSSKGVRAFVDEGEHFSEVG